MTRTPLLTQVIRAAAQKLAQDAGIPAAVRVEYQLRAERVLFRQFSGLIGGERVYTPASPAFERQERHERICAALGAGESSASIARRERVSRRWVNALAARMREQAAQAAGSAAP